MAKQSYGTSTGGVNKSAKGDLPSDRNTMSYGQGPLTDLSSKGSLPIDRDTRAYGPAPKSTSGRGNPPSNLPKTRGLTTVTPVKTKNIPRSYVPSRIKQIFDPTPFATPVVAKKPVAKKAVAKPAAKVISNVTREKLSPTQNSSVSRKPPATRFGTVTGKTTGTTVSGGYGYGGGGTRGGGSLSGQGSGSRTAGTSRTGGTRSNSPVRG